MATTKYIDIKLRTKSAETSADKLDGKMKGLGTTVDKTSNSFGVLSKVAAAVGTAIVTGQITKYADAYTSLQNQVRQTTSSTEELTQRTKDLLDISNRSRAGISSTSELYTQLVLSTENLNLSTEEQLRLTETITKSFAVSGKSAADAAGSIRQLSQAFASGTLRGDEFNSIAEGAPEIMRALQRSLNLTQGELRDLAATGGITAKILVDALGEAAEVIDNKFNDSTATMAQNIEVANNNLTEFIGSSTTVQNVMGGLGGAIVTASENIEDIANGATVIASVFAAKLIPSILLSTKAAASSALAFNADAIAKAKQSKETLQQVVADRALTAESVTKNRVLLQSIIVSKDLALQEVIRARSINAVTLANLEELKSNAARTQSAAFSSGLRLAAEERVVVANAASVASSKAIIAAEIELSAISARLTAQKAASTIATNAHAAAKTKEAAATGVLAAANTALTRSAVIATTASRALATSIAFLGGPLGIALIAGTALFAFNDIAFETKKASEKGAEGVNELTLAMKKLEEQTTKSQLKEIIKIENDTLDKLDKAESKLENLRKLSDSTRGKETFIGAAEREVDRLNKALDDVSAKRVALVGGIDTSGFDPIDDTGKTKDQEPAKQSPFSLRLSQETEALQIELALRQQVEQGYLSQRDADLSAAYLIDESRRALAFENELAKLSVDDESRTALTEQFNENALLRKQIYEDSLTGIEQEAANKRVSIAEQEAIDKQKFFDGLLNTSVNLGVALLKNEISSNAKSEKEKKRARKKGVLIDTAAGIARAFADHNFYVALGMSAAIAANGLTQISAINSASSVSAPTTSGSSTQAPTTPSANQQTPIRNRTVDIRTDGSAFSEAVKDAALVLFNSGDDDVVLNITNAQNELIRTSGVG